MDYNAKQNKKDIYGNTPLIYACLNGHYETTALLLQVRSLQSILLVFLMWCLCLPSTQDQYFQLCISLWKILGERNKSFCQLIPFNPIPSEMLDKFQKNITLLLDKYYLAIVQVAVFMELLCGRCQVFSPGILSHRVGGF